MNILHTNYLFDSCLYITLFLHTNLPLSPLPLPFLLFLLSNPFLLSLPFSTPYQETTNHLHTQKRINLYKKDISKKTDTKTTHTHYLQDDVPEGVRVSATPGGPPQGSRGSTHEEGQCEAEAALPGVACMGCLRGDITHWM